MRCGTEQANQRVNAAETLQKDPQPLYLAYNETQGAISDVLNVSIDKFIGSSSLNSDAVAKALWAGSNNGTGPVNSRERY